MPAISSASVAKAVEKLAQHTTSTVLVGIGLSAIGSGVVRSSPSACVGVSGGTPSHGCDQFDPSDPSGSHGLPVSFPMGSPLRRLGTGAHVPRRTAVTDNLVVQL